MKGIERSTAFTAELVFSTRTRSSASAFRYCASLFLTPEKRAGRQSHIRQTEDDVDSLRRRGEGGLAAASSVTVSELHKTPKQHFQLFFRPHRRERHSCRSGPRTSHFVLAHATHPGVRPSLRLFSKPVGGLYHTSRRSTCTSRIQWAAHQRHLRLSGHANATLRTVGAVVKTSIAWSQSELLFHLLRARFWGDAFRHGCRVLLVGAVAGCCELAVRLLVSWFLVQSCSCGGVTAAPRPAAS